jgi:hypothetical protein
MLSDPYKFTIAGTSLLNFATIDIAPGKSTRVVKDCGLSSDYVSPATLTISHTESKENGAVPTTRTLIRVDFEVQGFASGNPTGEKAKAAVYLVAVTPRLAGFGPDDMVGVVQDFFGSLCADQSDTAFSSAIGQFGGSDVSRILNGEP